MSGYSKINIVYRLQKWMDSVPGQTFLNYAYSWGASVVILGTLFKLTHLPGANLMLFIGMGTEVVVFFLSAFDRPFDKTAEGREIPSRVTEEYLETGHFAPDSMGIGAEVASSPQSSSVSQPVSVTILGGAASAGNAAAFSSEHIASSPSVGMAGGDASFVAAESAGMGSGTWIAGQPATTPEMVEAQESYVEELKKLVETLERVNEQSERLARDSEEMENLNRTLTGIARVYEMQLKSASQQMGTLDQISDQNRTMARQIEQLNNIYARMIEAMTVNMRAAVPETEARYRHVPHTTDE